MPSLFYPAPFALWQLLALAVIVVCASAGSVYLIRKHWPPAVTSCRIQYSGTVSPDSPSLRRP